MGVNIGKLVEDLEALGYTLETDGERIRYRRNGPPALESALPLLETLKRIKPYVIRYLLIHRGESIIDYKDAEIQDPESGSDIFSQLSVEDKVEAILARHPETRGLDKQLIVKLWLEEDNLAEVLGDAALVDRFAEWFTTRATYTESITRARRSIQAQGRYLPEPKHTARRNGRQQQYHDRYQR